MGYTKSKPEQGPYETRWGFVLLEKICQGDYLIRMEGVTLGRVVKRQGAGWRTEPDMAVIYTSRHDAIEGATTQWYQRNKSAVVKNKTPLVADEPLSDFAIDEIAEQHASGQDEHERYIVTTDELREIIKEAAALISNYAKPDSEQMAVPRSKFESLVRDMTTIASGKVPRGIPVREFAMHALADSNLMSCDTIPASEQATDGFVRVPLRMNRAMQKVVEQADWEWADLLVAANSVTEAEYEIALKEEVSKPVASVPSSGDLVELNRSVRLLQEMWDYCDDITKKDRTFGATPGLMRAWSNALSTVEDAIRSGNPKSTWQAQSNEADELLAYLGLDPQTYRTDGGTLNRMKIKAALMNPNEYPLNEQKTLPMSVIQALRFYAGGQHYLIDEDHQEFETVSGEPVNWLMSTKEDDGSMIEDGSIARLALQGKDLSFEQDSGNDQIQCPKPIAGEAFVPAQKMPRAGKASPN